MANSSLRYGRVSCFKGGGVQCPESLEVLMDRSRSMGHARLFFPTPQAAERLGLSPCPLEHYRKTGEGPVFHRFGRRVSKHQTRMNIAPVPEYGHNRQKDSIGNGIRKSCGTLRYPASRRRAVRPRPRRSRCGSSPHRDVQHLWSPFAGCLPLGKWTPPYRHAPRKGDPP